eukprot:6846692-Pyramimonas_sp.AAC.1
MAHQPHVEPAASVAHLASALVPDGCPSMATPGYAESRMPHMWRAGRSDLDGLRAERVSCVRLHPHPHLTHTLTHTLICTLTMWQQRR